MIVGIFSIKMKRREQSINMHRFFIFTGIIAIYSMVIFNTVSGGPADVVNICCYSTDPSSYDPKCYVCDASVYKNALMACLNVTDLPKNISFKAATCLEKNCQIQIPKISEAEVMKVDPILEFLKALMPRSKRSVFDNSVDESDSTKTMNVVKEVSTLVEREEREIKYLDTEYM